MDRSAKDKTPAKPNKLGEETSPAPLAPDARDEARNRQIDALFDATRAKFPKTIAALAKR
jgi:hypothetical protein